MCPGCQEMYSRREPEQEPPCETCKTELLRENEEAAAVFSVVRHQVIVVHSVVVDVNHLAVDAAMKRMNVKDERKCFHRVTKLFHSLLADKKQVMAPVP